MVNIKLVCVGKLKERYLEDACFEYKKRLSKYCNLSIVELPESFVPESPSKSQIDSALDKEFEDIEKACLGYYKIAMCIEGEELSSMQFSKKIDHLLSYGTGKIAFVIGSSYGLSDKLKSKSDMKLSFSRMTFPHQVFRVMVLEQVYRVFSILNGSKYHK